MIITNSNQLHYHLYEFMEDKMCFRKLKSMILQHKKKKKKGNFGSFSADFRFRAEKKKVTSRAELKILQLELWLEPARLGLIIKSYTMTLLQGPKDPVLTTLM